MLRYCSSLANPRSHAVGVTGNALAVHVQAGRYFCIELYWILFNNRPKDEENIFHVLPRSACMAFFSLKKVRYS
jgi:hypothetical protein